MKVSDKLLTLTGLSEIMIENLGTVSVETENEMKKCGLYMRKAKQTHKKIKNLHTKLSNDLDISVQDTENLDFIELCDFIMDVTMLCVAIPEGNRIKVESTLKTLIRH